MVGRLTWDAELPRAPATKYVWSLVLNGNRGQLAVEDHAKAEAFARNYAHFSRNVRLRHRDRAIKAQIKEANSVHAPAVGTTPAIVSPSPDRN